MKGPLSSLKVLDFSTLLPGPFASLLLADMGADVLRVESPGRMDLVRVLPPHVDGTSASHAYLNRNKRSIGLDLKRQGAREVVLELVREYDIVLEQFRPGVMDKLGVGYEALKAANPRLIYVAITGYGQTGPYRERAGHDINYLALAGVALGLGLLYLGIAASQGYVQANYGIYLPLAWPSNYEWSLLGAILAAAVLIGCVPAWRAYRQSLADGLSIRL